MFLCGFLLSVLAAQAEEPPTASLAALPADGRPRGVQLRAQTVDAHIREQDETLWADTRAWVYLYNPDRRQVVLPVTLSDPQLAPLPADLQVTLNNKALALTRLPAGEGEPPIGATIAVTVPAKGAASLHISYRQALPAGDGLARFTYPLAATANWGNRPESLRVTVRFDPPLATGQLLDAAPETRSRTHDALTWHWENTTAAADIALTFIAPAAWAELMDARARAAEDDSLAPHRTLAERYWRLATLAPPGDQSEAYFPRFAPLAIAALQAGLAEPGDAAPGEIAAAHIRLAEFYRLQAAHRSDTGGATHLQLAAAELNAALALEPGNQPARQAAAQVYRQLIAAAQADAPAAQDYQARLLALDAQPDLSAAPTSAQEAALALAEQAIAQGDMAAAAHLLVEAFGAEAITPGDAAAPRIRQALIAITVTRSGRAIEMQGMGAADAVSALMAESAQALAPFTHVEVSADRLAFALPAAAAPTINAEILAGAPELALLAAALNAPQPVWQVDAQPFLRAERYAATVDLRPAQTLWEEMARQLEVAAVTASAADGVTPTARLRRAQGALWAGDAAAWRELAERSRVTYQVALETQAETRSWELAAGDARTLTAEMNTWRSDRLAGVAGGTALLLALLVFAVWRAAVRA